MGFLTSPLGGYLIQSIFHSLIVVFVVEALIGIWGIRQPRSRLRFRLLVLVLPVLGWPFFQLIYPQRGSQAFREATALINVNRWLALEVGGLIPLGYILVTFMGLAALLFVFQEAIPAARHRLAPSTPLEPIPRGRFIKLDLALERVAGATQSPKPQVVLTGHPEPEAYVVGMAHQALALSPSLLELLDEEELEGVVAHEMVHFLRRDNLMGWVPLVFRSLMFYNPVALIAFRGITQENEKACDDRAAALTHKPLALAAALIKVFRGGKPAPDLPRRKAGGLASWGEALNRRAHRGLIEDRVLSLLHPARRQGPSQENLRLGLVVVAVGGLLFFVV